MISVNFRIKLDLVGKNRFYSLCFFSTAIFSATRILTNRCGIFLRAHFSVFDLILSIKSVEDIFRSETTLAIFPHDLAGIVRKIIQPYKYSMHFLRCLSGQSVNSTEESVVTTAMSI